MPLGILQTSVTIILSHDMYIGIHSHEKRIKTMCDGLFDPKLSIILIILINMLIFKYKIN